METESASLLKDWCLGCGEPLRIYPVGVSAVSCPKCYACHFHIDGKFFRVVLPRQKEPVES